MQSGVVAWSTKDGRSIRIRPIDAHDYAIEKTFIDGLSPETSYRRLLSGRKPQPDEIVRFTDVDPAREEAWIGVAGDGDDEIMCGVARYVRDGTTAEWAIVIADAWQGCGLGEALLRKVVDSARAAGVEVLSDVTFSTNGDMLRLARKLGFSMTRDARDATLTRMTMHL